MKYLSFILLLVFFSSCASNKKINGQNIGVKKQSKIEALNEKADLYISIGDNLVNRSKVARATENYKRAIKLTPNNYEAHFKLGRLLLKRGFFKEGLASINKAVKINKNYTEAYTFLAYYFYKRNRIKLAKRFVDKASEDLIYYNQEKIWALKLKVYKMLSLKDQINEVALKAFSTIPMSCSNRVSIALDLTQMNFKRPALKSIKQASMFCKTKKQKLKLSYVKGYVYYKKGEYAVAKELLLKVLAIDNSLNDLVPNLLLSIDKKMESSN